MNSFEMMLTPEAGVMPARPQLVIGQSGVVSISLHQSSKSCERHREGLVYDPLIPLSGVRCSHTLVGIAGIQPLEYPMMTKTPTR